MTSRLTKQTYLFDFPKAVVPSDVVNTPRTKKSKLSYIAEESLQEDTPKLQVDFKSNNDDLKRASQAKDRKFQEDWLTKFTWLEYNKEADLMTCKLCAKHGKKNTFTKGTNRKRMDVLTEHMLLIMNLLPVSNAICERGFSKLKVIKSNLRNSIESVNLDKALRIGIEAKRFKNFNFIDAFDHFYSKAKIK